MRTEQSKAVIIKDLTDDENCIIIDRLEMYDDIDMSREDLLEEIADSMLAPLHPVDNYEGSTEEEISIERVEKCMLKLNNLIADLPPGTRVEARLDV